MTFFISLTINNIWIFFTLKIELELYYLIIILLMNIYTSDLIEKLIDEKYLQDVKTKQKELDEIQKKTGKIQKYTAYAFVTKPDRIFHIKDGEVFVEINSKLVKIPNQSVPKGKTYRTDPKFNNQLSDFVVKHNSFKITFSVAGKYGPTIYYCGGPNVHPSKAEADNGDLLLMENEDNYDIGCM